jgi:excinuclease ABC subunit A
LTPEENVVGELLLSEIRERLMFLHEVGLDYLSLSRSAATLSGGEAQRIRLASQVGSGLQGVTYVLDEPSIGLHARDNQRLLQALVRLRDRGNSVLVVEHDAETILAADHIVDVGPAAGRLGGLITAEGAPMAFLGSDCPTAAWMRGERRMPPAPRRGPAERALVVVGAVANTLREVTVGFPIGRFTAVTGVSGSGKSSLVFGVLEPSVERALQGISPVHCQRIDGLDQIDKIVRISQRPIGRTPRSNPATYTGAMDLVRDLFAELPESKARGYARGRFSFNVAGGRCEECEGAGVKTIEMQFLPDVEVPCEACGGRRFNRETLEVRYKGRTIAEVLELTIGEAAGFFGAVPKLARILNTMVEVGLDYLTLGQTSTTLSGGEAQRVKLATELHRPASGRTLYLLDEPTTGLHFEDVSRLLVALDRLVAHGNTVVVVEHHTDVIAFADHVIDLGPDGGDAGGHLVGEGAPEAVARLDTPTGRALAAVFAAPVQVAPSMTVEVLDAARRGAEARHVSGALAAEPGGSWSLGGIGVEGRPGQGPTAILVQGARKHNLQGVDVRLPHGQLSVITGVSGSGKTSLALDTIFAEGQRRYVEALSTYARRFLGRLDRAPVDKLEGLQPAIAIDQSSSRHNPRSTVATVTEIHDVLRLLYARVGTPHCPQCRREVAASSPSRVAAVLGEAGLGAGWLCAPLRPAADGPARVKLLGQAGWSRLLVREAGGDGWSQLDLSEAGAAEALRAGALLVIDRLDPGTAERARLAEAIASAYAEGDGQVVFVPRRGQPVVATEQLVCPEHGALTAELTPRHFSFNARVGMCTRCEGIGTVRQVLPERLIVRDGPIREALDPRLLPVLDRNPRLNPLLDALIAAHGLPTDAPVARWPKVLLGELLHGRTSPLEIRYQKRVEGSMRDRREVLQWTGLVGLVRDGAGGVSLVTADVPCPDCGGGRLGPVPSAVTLEGMNLPAFARLTVEGALAATRGWQLDGERAAIASRPQMELERRLGFLVDVGLGYLTLDRSAESLSGGEGQRIRLASQLGAGLVGVTYVLDEPTVGLHARDTDKLMRTLEGLRDQGNTLVVVEHDPDVIGRADHLVDMGPGAGTEGGRVLAAGTPAAVCADPASVTGAWLSGRLAMPARAVHKAASTGRIVLEGARANNLRVDRVEVPLGRWTAVTGVSGSGKSSLMMDTLAPALKVHIGEEGQPGPYRRLVVEGKLDGVVVVDQAPIGTTPRGTPATYVGMMDKLRQLYASLPGSLERGWAPGRFSFNAAGGRCEACEGRGAQLIEMHFLPDVWVVCAECRGRRYDARTLEVRFKGHSIADVLAMRADAAIEVFQQQRPIRRALEALVDVGLGYIRLGQPATTLSGGEAQRVKLAAELISRAGSRVYVLDEPTTGLHLADVAKLIAVLQKLVAAGNTVITIEHHLDMIRQADHVIELGPDGGAGGGLLVAAGPPAVILAAETATGVALRSAARSA